MLTARDPSEAPFRFLPLRPKSHSDPGSLTTGMVDVLVNKLETLIASMLEIDVNKWPPDVAYVKQQFHEMSTLWSDIRQSFWRPKLGYTQQMRNKELSSRTHSAIPVDQSAECGVVSRVFGKLKSMTKGLAFSLSEMVKSEQALYNLVAQLVGE